LTLVHDKCEGGMRYHHLVIVSECEYHSFAYIMRSIMKQDFDNLMGLVHAN
jgi:hypothetical protein